MYTRQDKTPYPFLLLLILGLMLGCASDGGDGPNYGSSTTGGLPSGGYSKGKLILRLSVNPNGRIDTSGRGIYAILFNSQGTPIEATDIDTFTDFIRFDGRSFDWYHRLAQVPNPGFTFTQVGPLAGIASVAPDGKTAEIVLDLTDPTNYLNQFIVSGTFTVHVVTTDNDGNYIGRLIDTLGQGPNIAANSTQTITVKKGLGALNPLPSSYPVDPLNDVVVHDDLGEAFPYANFDISRFEVIAK